MRDEQGGLAMGNALIVLAGATGNLGRRVAQALLKHGAKVRALVRHESAPDKVKELQEKGVEVVVVNFNDLQELTKACAGGHCLVSTLVGLRDVIVDLQTMLLNAAVKAGVPRFIPSDFSIDYTKLPPSANRNLSFRQEFRGRLDKAPISATSILNGMFMDLLVGPAPIILFNLKRVVYWGNPDQLLDFTAIDNVAEFTALAALDPSTPRFLRIAGDQISARGLAEVASEVTGKRFRLLRAGSLKTLEVLIKVTRMIRPQRDALYPIWQGMQYLHNMFSGQAKLEPLDNDRYPSIRWIKVQDFLAAYFSP